MAFSSLIGDYVGRGLASARPVTPNISTGATAIYLSTDTGDVEIWDGTAWQPVGGGGGGSIDVEDEGVVETAAATVLNFTGAGVTVTDAGGGVADIDIPGGGGGGGAWTLASTTTIGSPVTEVDVTGLGTPTEIMVVLDAVTTSVSGQRQLLLSVDNGATFFTASGDYITTATNGTPSNATAIPVAGNASAGARTGGIQIFACDTAATAKRYTGNGSATLEGLFKGSASQIDAIRVTNSVASNLTGGTIYVFTR